jgi:hypothetical protein
VSTIQFRRGTASQWTTTNPTLAAGELGFEIDTGKFKIGTGSTTWTALAYASSGGGGGTDFAVDTHAATSKATPVDADEFPLVDSAASFGKKKWTAANIKAWMKAYLDGTGIAKLTTARNIDGQPFDGTAAITVIAPGTHAATSKATPVNADEFPLVDSAASNVLKRLTWANLLAAVTATFTDDFAAKQDVSTLTTDIATAFNGITITVDYDTVGAAWPTLDTTLAASTSVAWLFRFGDESTPPPTVSGKASWVRKIA